MIRKKLFIAIFLSTGLFLQAETAKVDFVTEVKPIFEAACIGCHYEKKDKGDYRMDTKELAFKGGENYPDECIIPGDAEGSQVYYSVTLPKDDDEVMPPGKDELLTKAQQETIKNWINQGAKWPDGVVLKQTSRLNFQRDVLPILQKGGPFSEKQKGLLRLWVNQGSVWPEGFSMADAGGGGPKDDLDLVIKIREAIVAGSPEKAAAEMKAYDSKIPKTGAKYSMVPIPGGEFMIGSPAGESDRLDDEGPQHKVKIEPFWMGKFEVTWDMYEPFMITADARNKDGSLMKVNEDSDAADITSKPTAPYTEMSFGMGLDGYPAISMTQHAANKFCQWLSAQTGHFYRLPTEAEWEYACRAGSTGPFSCKPEELKDYAVFETQPDNPILAGYARIGTKKANPWGLYDMHGNVMEWCIDQYVADAYKTRSGSGNAVITPFVKPTELYPRVARGGSWYDPAPDVRSARRWGSEENWKQQDPQLPKSIWYHTDALWLGFRLVRPLKVPDVQKMHLFWNCGRPADD
jgi:formylglycine-generating enzyme required for sulfatase activity